MEVLHLTKDTFKEEVMESGKKVLVDFFASWCGPCKMLSPIIDEIAKENSDIQVYKVNIDEELELTELFNIQSVPTLVVIENGKTIDRNSGLLPKAGILEMLNK